MARPLENYTNVQAPTVDYPNGRIKDDPGDGTGTPVNEATNGDLQQFLRQLLVEGNVTPNDLPENVSNGFQYIEALFNYAVRDSLAANGYFSSSARISTNVGSTRTVKAVKIRGGKVFASHALGVNHVIEVATIGAAGPLVFSNIATESNTVPSIAIDEDANFLYAIVNSVGIKRYDLSNNTSTTLVVSGQVLQGIAVRDGRLYVGSRTAGTIRIFNATSGADLGTLASAGDIVDIAVDGNTVFVVDDVTSRVYLYDIGSGALKFDYIVSATGDMVCIDVQGGKTVCGLTGVSGTQRKAIFNNLNTGDVLQELGRDLTTDDMAVAAKDNELITVDGVNTTFRVFDQLFYER